jgi:hypothetical protein
MTDQEPAERGRYAVYPIDGGAIVARATDLCETCSNCGCGTQQENMDLTPAGVMKLISKHGFKLPSPKEFMKMAASRGK